MRKQRVIDAGEPQMPITIAAVCRGLKQQVSGYLTHQQTIPDRFDTGAVIRADWGIDDPGGTTGLVALALWIHLVDLQYPGLVGADFPDDTTLAQRSLLALGYL